MATASSGRSASLLPGRSGAPLLQKCKTLADGYYDVSGLTLSVHLDPPEGIDPRQWASVHNGSFMELSFPSTSSGSCAGQVRPVNTVFYIPI